MEIVVNVPTDSTLIRKQNFVPESVTFVRPGVRKMVTV
jgi:hypothetical protein